MICFPLQRKKPERFKKNEKSLRTTDYADATDVFVKDGYGASQPVPSEVEWVRGSLHAARTGATLSIGNRSTLNAAIGIRCPNYWPSKPGAPWPQRASCGRALPIRVNPCDPWLIPFRVKGGDEFFKTASRRGSFYFNWKTALPTTWVLIMMST